MCVSGIYDVNSEKYNNKPSTVELVFLLRTFYDIMYIIGLECTVFDLNFKEGSVGKFFEFSDSCQIHFPCHGGFQILYILTGVKIFDGSQITKIWHTGGVKVLTFVNFLSSVKLFDSCQNFGTCQDFDIFKNFLTVL